MNKHFFRQRHPLVISSYYMLILLMAMSSINPVIISCFFFGSLIYQLTHLQGQQKQVIIFPLIFLGILTLTNPLFIHRGGTIIFFLINKPITLEAFSYGFFLGMMVAAMIYLFQNFQSAVDSEQFFYLFGKRFPKLTLILTMVFRFIPRFKQYYQELKQVQKTLQQTQKRNFKQKASYGYDLFGNLFSWALENTMDTADSMNARGYGITTRSSRITYTWKKMDTLSLLLLMGSASLFIFYVMRGHYQFTYYPYQDDIFLRIKQRWFEYLLVFVLAFLPVFNRVWEGIIWTILKSKI